VHGHIIASVGGGSTLRKEEVVMSLVRWNPFTEIDGLLNRMMRPGAPRLFLEGGDGMEFLPAADIRETETEYLVHAELPGVAKEDVKVTLDGGILTIAGERKRMKEETNEKAHLVERYYGKFRRWFALPDSIVADALRCEFKDGVLAVHIPKEKQEVPREIAIH
jgi:HSP20 family protein